MKEDAFVGVSDLCRADRYPCPAPMADSVTCPDLVFSAPLKTPVNEYNGDTPTFGLLTIEKTVLFRLLDIFLSAPNDHRKEWPSV